jgi:hypothetical protein
VPRNVDIKVALAKPAAAQKITSVLIGAFLTGPLTENVESATKAITKDNFIDV